MLFILNKDSYTIEEDANHHTVNISLPPNIENTRSMTVISFSALGLPYDGTEIVLTDRESGEKNRIWVSGTNGGVSDGKKCTEGFMYGDALISAAIIMFMLPIVLSVFWMATITIYKAYYWDHILQDTYNVCRGR